MELNFVFNWLTLFDICCNIDMKFLSPSVHFSLGVCMCVFSDWFMCELSHFSRV